MKPRMYKSALPLACLVAFIFQFEACKPEKPELSAFRVSKSEEEASTAFEQKLKNTVVASIGDYDITAYEIKQILSKLPPYQRYYYSDPEKAELFIRNYVAFLILSREAYNQGFIRDPYVRIVVKDALARAYKKHYLSHEVKISDRPDSEVESYVRRHKEELQKEAGTEDEQKLETFARSRLLQEKKEEAWVRHLKELKQRATVELLRPVQNQDKE